MVTTSDFARSLLWHIFAQIKLRFRQDIDSILILERVGGRYLLKKFAVRNGRPDDEPCLAKYFDETGLHGRFKMKMLLHFCCDIDILDAQTCTALPLTMGNSGPLAFVVIRYEDNEERCRRFWQSVMRASEKLDKPFKHALRRHFSTERLDQIDGAQELAEAFSNFSADWLRPCSYRVNETIVDRSAEFGSKEHLLSLSLEAGSETIFVEFYLPGFKPAFERNFAHQADFGASTIRLARLLEKRFRKLFKRWNDRQNDRRLARLEQKTDGIMERLGLAAPPQQAMAPKPVLPDFQFYQDEDKYWHFRFDGKTIVLDKKKQNLQGLTSIRLLLRQLGQRFTAAKLKELNSIGYKMSRPGLHIDKTLEDELLGLAEQTIHTISTGQYDKVVVDDLEESMWAAIESAREEKSPVIKRQFLAYAKSAIGELIVMTSFQRYEKLNKHILIELSKLEAYSKDSVFEVGNRKLHADSKPLANQKYTHDSLKSGIELAIEAFYGFPDVYEYFLATIVTKKRGGREPFQFDPELALPKFHNIRWDTDGPET